MNEATPINNVTLPIKMSDDIATIIREHTNLVSNDPEAFKIKNQGDYEYVVDLIKKLKAAGKQVEEARKELGQPFLDFKRQIDDEHNAFTKTFVGENERKGKSAMRDWDNEQERKRAKAQADADERARKKEERLRAKADAAAENGNLEKAEALDQQANAVSAKEVEAPDKMEGTAVRFVYDVVVNDRKAFIAAAAMNPVLSACLHVNESELKKLAKMMGDEFDFPGVTATKRRDYSIRS